VYIYISKYKFALFLPQDHSTNEKDMWRDRRSRNLVNRKCRCIYLYKRKMKKKNKNKKKVIWSIHKMKELYEIFNYQSSYKKSPHTYIYTHTLAQLCLCRSRILYQWIDSLTHQWTAKRKEGEKRFDGRWRWEIFITGCTYIYIYIYIYINALFSFWLDIQVFFFSFSLWLCIILNE
jgi:hypothetical protein